MRLRELGIRLRDEKQVLRNGIILLSFAAVLILILMKFDQVWGALCLRKQRIALFYAETMVLVDDS